jgi:hypothetical protein
MYQLSSAPYLVSYFGLSLHCTDGMVLQLFSTACKLHLNKQVDQNAKLLKLIQPLGHLLCRFCSTFTLQNDAFAGSYVKVCCVAEELFEAF